MDYWGGNVTLTNLTNPIAVFYNNNNNNNNIIIIVIIIVLIYKKKTVPKKCGINPNRLSVNQVN